MLASGPATKPSRDIEISNFRLLMVPPASFALQ
jgi:hypothetical protein